MPKVAKFLVDIVQSEASNKSSFSDLPSKALILPPSRLFTVTQEFSPEIVRIVRAIGIVTARGENEHTLTAGFSRAGNQLCFADPCPRAKADAVYKHSADYSNQERH